MPMISDLAEVNIWWKVPDGGLSPEGLDRLIGFENSVYGAFPLKDPPSNLRLLTRAHEVERSLLGDGPASSDDEAIVRALAWLPWHRIVGFRAAALADNFLLGQSVEAQVYYTPAYMLHSLHLRRSDGLDVLELFLPPDDPVVLSALSQSRSDSEGTNRAYAGHYMDRATEFRQPFNTKQREVISQYLELWVPWHCSNRGKTGLEHLRPIMPAFERLLAYWRG